MISFVFQTFIEGKVNGQDILCPLEEIGKVKGGGGENEGGQLFDMGVQHLRIDPAP